MADAPLSPKDLSRVDQLIQLYIDRQLTPSEATELLHYIQSSQVVANLMIGHVQLSQLLHDLAGERDVLGMPSISEIPSKTASSSWNHVNPVSKRWSLSGLIVLCLVLGLGIVGQFILDTNWGGNNAKLSSQPPTAEVPAPVVDEDLPGDDLTTNAVAVVSRTWSLEPEDDVARFAEGTTLSPGRIQLQKGILRIDFFSGARVTFQAPCDFDLVSRSHVVCRTGHLTANVPSQARGFRIETPHGTVVDLGTGFGITVNEDQADVHVFEGLVELPDFSNKRIPQGQGVTLAEGRLLAPFPADRSLFAALTDIDDLHQAAFEKKKQQRQEYIRKMHQDPDLLIHFDFNLPNFPSDPTLPNLAPLSPVGPGVIVGCRPTTGRWPGESALEFQSLSDRVRLTVPESFIALTLTAWVRVDSLPHKFSSLIMTEGFDAGEVHWQVQQSGEIRSCVANQFKAQRHVDSPRLIDKSRFGDWSHLAVVIEQSANRISHYFNGEFVGQQFANMPEPLRIGEADLGNWTNPVDNWPVRNLNGALGEFTIHSRALNAQEILALYEAGSPIIAMTSNDLLESTSGKPFTTAEPPSARQPVVPQNSPNDVGRSVDHDDQ